APINKVLFIGDTTPSGKVGKRLAYNIGPWLNAMDWLAGKIESSVSAREHSACDATITASHPVFLPEGTARPSRHTVSAGDIVCCGQCPMPRRLAPDCRRIARAR